MRHKKPAADENDAFMQSAMARGATYRLACALIVLGALWTAIVWAAALP